MKKKLLAVILALTLGLSAMPFSVLAEEITDPTQISADEDEQTDEFKTDSDRTALPEIEEQEYHGAAKTKQTENIDMPEMEVQDDPDTEEAEDTGETDNPDLTRDADPDNWESEELEDSDLKSQPEQIESVSTENADNAKTMELEVQLAEGDDVESDSDGGESGSGLRKTSPTDEEGVVASGVCGENISWKLDDSGLLTISGEGSMVNSSMGERYLDYEFYEYYKDTKSVVIEEGITNVGSFVYWDYPNLKSVTLPASVTYIGSGAFMLCKSLEYVELQEGLESINYEAFLDCESLKKITLPDSVRTIGEMAFFLCGFSEIIVPAGVTKIESAAFGSSENLHKVFFKGNCPATLGKDMFDELILDAYYPENNWTWSSAILKSYGATKITWNEWDAGLRDISGCTVKLQGSYQTDDGEDAYVYTGDQICPEIEEAALGSKVLSEGTDFSVTYGVNKNYGTGTVMLTGMGEYSGEKHITFQIIPDKVSGLKGNNDLSTDTAACTNYKRGLDIVWTGIGDNSFLYEIQYSKFSDFHEKEIIAVPEGTNSFSEIEEPLDRNEIYYVRVRAYMEIAGKYINGLWSDTLKVKSGRQILASEMWGLRNSSSEYPEFSITKEQFFDVYGEGNGETLFDYYGSFLDDSRKDSNKVTAGLCEGLVYSGIAYHSFDVPPYGSYKDAVTGVNYTTLKSDRFNLKWLDIVKYAQILQMADRGRVITNGAEYDLSGLYEAVRNCEQGNGEPVLINVGKTNYAGHAIMAVGISEDSSERVEIEVYDVNSIKKNQAVPRKLYLYRTGNLIDRWEYEEVIRYDPETEEVSEAGKMEGSIYENPGNDGVPYLTYRISDEFEAEVLNEINENGYVKNLQINPGVISKEEEAFKVRYWYESNHMLEQNLARKALEEQNISAREIKVSFGDQEQNVQTDSEAYWIDSNTIDLSDVPAGSEITLSRHDYSARVVLDCVSDIHISLQDDKNSAVTISSEDEGQFLVIMTDAE